MTTRAPRPLLLLPLAGAAWLALDATSGARTALVVVAAGVAGYASLRLARGRRARAAAEPPPAGSAWACPPAPGCDAVRRRVPSPARLSRDLRCGTDQRARARRRARR